MEHRLTIANGAGLSRYLRDIWQFPALRPQGDMRSQSAGASITTALRRKRSTSHLRLIASIAMGYRGYGIPLSEVISESTIGLMQAIKGFDPERGC